MAQAPSTRPESEHPEKDAPTFAQIASVILDKLRTIIPVSLGVAVATLAINFAITPYYKSTVSLLPETKKDKLSSLGQFADIAQLAGVNMPGSEIARLYPTILSSETILRSVIEKKYQTKEFSQPVNLIEYFDYPGETPEENMAKTLKKIRSLMISGFDNKTSVVTVSIEMPEPQLAADVANAIVTELDQFMRNKRTTSASEQVKWIDVRITEIMKNLETAENTLKDFRERNRRVADSPELLLKQERLARDIQVKSTIFVELKKQYELAKLDEIKNITIVNVLDPGRAAVKKERPARLTNSALMFLLAFIGSAAYFLLKAFYLPRMVKFWSMYRSA